jgi:hypothetical protein
VKPIPLREVKRSLCAIALGLLLASCGRNGTPLPPPGVPEDQSPPFINGNTSGSLNPSNSAEEKQVQQNAPSQAEGQPVNTLLAKPRKPFFLDPLL